MSELTVNQHILLAAAGLPERFHESDLVEAAWRSAPRLLGMTGKHDTYPSDNKVRSALSGDRGLARRGWLIKCGKLMYELSRQGKAEAARILAGDTERPRRPLATIKPTLEVEAVLEQLSTARAMRLLRSNMGEQVNRTDAFGFWGNYGPEGIDGVVVEARGCLVGGVVKLRSGREVSEHELSEVSRVNAWLSVKFGRDLERQAAKAAAG